MLGGPLLHHNGKCEVDVPDYWERVILKSSEIRSIRVAYVPDPYPDTTGEDKSFFAGIKGPLSKHRRGEGEDGWEK